MIKDTKIVKTTGSSGIVTDMLKMPDEVVYLLVSQIVNQVIQENFTHDNRYSSIVVNCFKGKRDWELQVLTCWIKFMNITESVIAQLNRS